ncbi:unnamed protein product [Rhizophagus irregularis]|nr:unnamed protein product [Rhizophagus irregularis]
MEVADKPIKRKKWFPTVPKASRIIVFLKYFDPDNTDFRRSRYSFKNLRRSQTKYDRRNAFRIHFQQSEIQDGDIICFQKALTEREIQEHRSVCRCWNIPHFYESLALRIVVSFKPKLEDRSIKTRMTYEQVSLF